MKTRPTPAGALLANFVALAQGLLLLAAIVILLAGFLLQMPAYFLHGERCPVGQRLVTAAQAEDFLRPRYSKGIYYYGKDVIPGADISFPPRVGLTEGRDWPLVTPLHWTGGAVGRWRGHTVEVPFKFTRCGEFYDLGGTYIFD